MKKIEKFGAVWFAAFEGLIILDSEEVFCAKHADNQLRWVTKIIPDLFADWSNLKHCGDCVKACGSCTSCFYQEIIDMANSFSKAQKLNKLNEEISKRWGETRPIEDVVSLTELKNWAQEKLQILMSRKFRKIGGFKDNTKYLELIDNKVFICLDNGMRKEAMAYTPMDIGEYVNAGIWEEIYE